MSDTEPGSTPLFLISWFPGVSRPEVLARLKDAGVDGIELRHVDDESCLIRDTGLRVSFHLPFLRDGSPQEINLVNERILAPYREGRMAGLAVSSLPYLGFHFGYSALEIEKQRCGPDAALTPTLPRAEVAARMRPIVAELAARTGKQILLENLDYGPTGAVEYVCEPGFLRECAEAWGCGTLLDVAHAMVSARPLGYTVEGYLAEMLAQTAPLIRSLHLNSPEEDHDAHLAVTPEVLGWLRRALDAGACPATIVLERAWPEGIAPLQFAESLLGEMAQIRDVCRIR